MKKNEKLRLRAAWFLLFVSLVAGFLSVAAYAETGCQESDSGGSGTDALFSQPLQENVPYLVIVTAFNPASQSGSFTLWIDEFDS